ncbi:unnamed protein product [Amoebophrya sp. A25]|nr:unnamed protein product [Amoebophrya sp. A25]|eukprot:GSA25T00006328001.1
MPRPRLIRVFLQSDPMSKMHAPLAQLAADFSGAEFAFGLTPNLKGGGATPDFLQKCEVMIISPFTGGGDENHLIATVAALPNLKWVHSLAAGVDKFVGTLRRQPATQHLPLTNARGAYSYALGEYALFAMLYFNKQARRLNALQQAKQWDPFCMDSLRGKTLGFIAFGSIGEACWQLAKTLPWSRVLVHRRTRTRDDEFSEDFPTWENPSTNNRENAMEKLIGYASREDVFAKADVVICSLPGTEETRHYCDMASFSLMKDGAIFISLGRGSCVDEEAVIEHAGRLGGVALDVFEREPLPQSSPLWSHPNVLMSPHNADRIASYMSDGWDTFQERFNEYAAGKAFSDSIVDMGVGY